MPKFMTYQRPAPVNKQHWNGNPKQQQPLPRKSAVDPKIVPPVLPGLEALLKKD